MAHLATIRYTKGLGNSALYVRARDGTAQYWNWSTLQWSATEVSATKQSLTERQDSDAAESRYMVSVALPPAVQSILEYVLVSTNEVLGEESMVPQTVIQIAGTLPSTPDPALCVVSTVLFKANGAPDIGATATARISVLPHETPAGFFSGQVIRATVGADGVAQWTLPRGASVLIQVTDHGIEHTVIVPDAAEAWLGDLM